MSEVIYFPPLESEPEDTYDRETAAEEKAMHDYDDLHDNGLL
jgi:hypothetical protein